jgi:hypothetical protein
MIVDPEPKVQALLAAIQATKADPGVKAVLGQAIASGAIDPAQDVAGIEAQIGVALADPAFNDSLTKALAAHVPLIVAEAKANIIATKYVAAHVGSPLPGALNSKIDDDQNGAFLSTVLMS